MNQETRVGTNTLEVLSNDPALAGLPSTPRPVRCEFCGAERHTEGLRLTGEQVLWFTSPRACSCPAGAAQEAELDRLMAERVEREKAAKARERVERLTRDSGMNERGLRQTFQNFIADTAERKRILGIARDYAHGFSRLLPQQGQPLPGRNGFLISGTKGTGKTHIASAIANHLLSRETALICTTERNLFDRIRRAYTPGELHEGQVRGVYERIPLLVIDDLGKEKATNWTLATLYAVIDGRYERAMPLIVTTNYDARSLITRLTPEGGDKTTADAILDRIAEMCEFLLMAGESWRARL